MHLAIACRTLAFDRKFFANLRKLTLVRTSPIAGPKLCDIDAVGLRWSVGNPKSSGGIDQPADSVLLSPIRKAERTV